MIKKKLFMALLYVMLATLLMGPICDNGVEIPERYFLAFAKEGSSEVRVRYSANGINWEDGNFPAGVAGTSFRGVSALADKHGLLHVVVTDGSNNEMNFVWGLGPAVWDNSSRSEAVHPIVSAPSVVDIGDNIFVIAYQRTGGTVAVFVYDHSERRFKGGDLAPIDQANSNVEGRPSITYMNGKLLLTWRKWDSDIEIFRLFTSVGQIQAAIPTFSQPREIPLPSTNDLKAGLESDPDVTHDHNQFYVAFVREQRGSPLHGWEVTVHSSLDGNTWQVHSSTLSSDVNNVTNISIAGKSTGMLMVAAVKRNTGRISVSKFSNGQWSALNDSAVQGMFGSNKASPKQFALIGTGKP